MTTLIIIGIAALLVGGWSMQKVARKVNMEDFPLRALLMLFGVGCVAVGLMKNLETFLIFFAIISVATAIGFLVRQSL